MPSRTSEIALFLILVVIVGFVRVYYGKSQDIMVVWKGEFSYADTLVNLDDIISKPREQVSREHPDVYYQLESMGFYDGDDVKPRYRKSHTKPASPVDAKHLH